MFIVIFKWINKHLKYFPVLASDMVNNTRYNSYEQKAFGDPVIFKSEKGSWHQSMRSTDLIKTLILKMRKQTKRGEIYCLTYKDRRQFPVSGLDSPVFPSLILYQLESEYISKIKQFKFFTK